MIFFSFQVALSNGKIETKIVSELGTQNNRRPNTLPLSVTTAASNKPVVNSTQGADLFGSQPQLKDLTSRVKTPGDVPLAVRRMRGQKNLVRFSLYDDRMMSGCYDDEKLFSYPPKAVVEENGHRSSLDDTHFTQDI